MHPVTQGILSVGVLALVGLGGFAVVYGVPTQEKAPTSLERLEQAALEAGEAICRIKLSRPHEAYNAQGKRERAACLLKSAD